MRTEDLREILDKFNIYQRAAFGASCCERLITTYEAFLLQENVNDQQQLRHSLNSIWEFVIETDIAINELEKLVQNSLLLERDADEYESVFTGIATNAVLAVAETLQCCIDGESQHIVNVVELILESIDGYLQIVTEKGVGVYAHDPNMNSWIDQSPLMQGELSQQQSDLEYIELHKKLSLQQIQKIRERSQEIGIHPVQRGLLIK